MSVLGGVPYDTTTDVGTCFQQVYSMFPVQATGYAVTICRITFHDHGEKLLWQCHVPFNRKDYRILLPEAIPITRSSQKSDVYAQGINFPKQTSNPAKH